MRESREALLVVTDACYPDAVARAFEAADDSDDPVRAGADAIVTMAELNPDRARAALWRLQTDWTTLSRIERYVGGEPTQAALRIGAVIQLARAELASPTPHLRQRLPELMEWLGQRELSAAE
jgi:hypothetical protein